MALFTRSAVPKVPPRVSTPTVLQMEVVECGAAALGIVLGWYGTIVPLEQLRIACGVSRDGGNAANILRAARTFGFKAQGFKRSPDRLRKGPFPVILFWKFNHFLVLEGVKGDTVYLNDPAVGQRTVTWKELDEAFTGVVLEISPGEGWKPSGRAPSLFHTLRQRLTGATREIVFLLLCGLLLTLVGLTIPAFTRIFIDKYLVAGFESWLVPLFAMMAAGIALSVGVTWLMQYALLRLEVKLAVATSSRFFWHVLRLPIEFFHQRRAADIAGRVSLNDQIAQLLAGDMAINALNVLLIGFYTIIMARYDVPLTLVGVALALLNIAVLRYFSRRRTDATQRMLHSQGTLMGKSFSGLQIIETLKATGREDDFFSEWAGTQALAVNAEQGLNSSSELLSALPSLVLSVGSTLIVTLGGLRIVAGDMSFGELIAFQALFTSFMLPVNQLVALGTRLQRTRGEMVRMDDVLKYQIDAGAIPVSPATSTDSVSRKLSGHLALRNITFGYNRLGEPLLRDFNLDLTPGSRVALVGGSGSGKSTVAKLVVGIYKPWSGEILLDGQTLEQVPFTQLKQSLAMVDQDIYLYEGTVRDNLTLWDDSIPDAHIVQAARDADIHENIVARPGSYGFMLDENGGNLSGGQRQRLEIARALVNNPTILVLDEATSALDPLTEQTIDNNLRRRGCTCLIVAHRLSTIRDCDEIIVLDRGRVVQRGSHEELIRVPGKYASLIRSNDSTRSNLNNLLDLFQTDEEESEGRSE